MNSDKPIVLRLSLCFLGHRLCGSLRVTPKTPIALLLLIRDFRKRRSPMPKYKLKRQINVSKNITAGTWLTTSVYTRTGSLLVLDWQRVFRQGRASSFSSPKVAVPLFHIVQLFLKYPFSLLCCFVLVWGEPSVVVLWSKDGWMVVGFGLLFAWWLLCCSRACVLQVVVMFLSRVCIFTGMCTRSFVENIICSRKYFTVFFTNNCWKNICWTNICWTNICKKKICKVFSSSRTSYASDNAGALRLILSHDWGIHD